MTDRSDHVVQTTKRLAAERQIHAAIKHYRAGDFECAITLSSAAEGQTPEPDRPIHAFRLLMNAYPDEVNSDDLNFASHWLKHGWGRDDVEIPAMLVRFWLNRAISKYRAVYGIGTSEMADMFPWAGTPASGDPDP